MKKLSIAIGIAIASCFSGAAVSATISFATQEFPPFNYKGGSGVAGPGVDIINAVTKSMGDSATFKIYPWSRAQDLVKKGKVDGLFLLGKNKKRMEWLYYTPPIITTEYGFFVQTSAPLQYKAPSDIKGMKVGVFGPSNTSNSLNKLAKQVDIKVDMTNKNEAVFKKLSSGRVDAVYSNRDVGNSIIKKLGITNLRYAGAQKPVTYYIAFSKEGFAEGTVKSFNEHYLKLKASGEIGKIVSGYNMTLAD
ncbi:substrate-binding periplasmic protein [Dongshaea marina]|uniref:substrate-binding periplasmic protein n=1 Tax=Dongshaea marina TaxID=2047966 RepID=UPI00131EFC4E|nr:transporter substrate-binding domain-containing protein [Dongshaea marina]